MEIARIEVGRTTGHCIRRARIPAGIVGASVRVSFADPIWDNLIKTVVFRGKETRIAEFDGTVAVIPYEVVAQEGVSIFFGIFGHDPETDLQLPLIEVRLGSTEAATNVNADPGADPALPIWAQLQQDVEELKQSGGVPGEPGKPGEDGGHYIPAVEQLDEDTIQFSFTPSKTDMPAVEPVTVELPAGQGSGGQNVELDTTLTVEGKAADAKAVGDKIDAVRTFVNDNPEIKFRGYYINQIGTLLSLGSGSVYKPIKLSVGDTIYFTATGYQKVVSVLSRKEEGTEIYIPVICSEDDNEHEFTYTADTDGYYVITSLHNPAKYRVLYTNPLSDLIGNVEKADSRLSVLENNCLLEDVFIPNYAYSGYVNKGGYLSPQAHYVVSDPFPVKLGEKIAFTSNLLEADAKVMFVLSEWSQDGTTYLKGIQLGTASQEVVYSPTKTVEYLRITKSINPSYPTTDPIITAVMKDVVSGLADKVSKFENSDENDVFPFIRVGVVGDSMASGATNFEKADGTVTTADRPEYSWGKFMEREHGVEVKLFSEGGTSTRTWLTRSTGLSAMNSAEPCDCYIIGLGLNESALWGMEYIGTDADVNIGNENSNADTMYGNYSKIIAALTAKSPRCKVFCLTMPGTSDLLKSFNIAIRNVAAMYDNAHVIDLEGDPYFESGEYKKFWYFAHSTAAGYKSIAGHLWKRMNEYIVANASDFLDVQWIFENHS